MFRHILVGDIWLMAGQSNMYGSVRLEEKLPALPYLNMLNFELIREEPHWCAGKSTGLTLRNQKTGLDESWIFKIEFDPARPNVVLLRSSGAFPRNQMQLCYATGPTPYANIQDQGGMPLPALGPMQIAE